jgi:hypothetical protein
MARRILIILGHSDARPDGLGCAFAETSQHRSKSFERNVLGVVRGAAMHAMRSGIAEGRGVAPRALAGEARRDRSARRLSTLPHPPLRCSRWLPVLAFASALGACATAVIVPTQVRFPSLAPASEAVPLFDVRPSVAREYREAGRSHTFKFFADDAMQPSPVDLVASCLGEALPQSWRGSPIELRRLDIGFLVAPRSLLPTSSDTSIAVPAGTPAGAIAAGVLLAYGMIAAFIGTRADQSGVAYIEVEIGAASLRTAQTVTITDQVGAREAVETALAVALDDLADQARALRSREPGTP